jgi:dihydrofolate synthase/folylpolyglutamate synthase
VNGKHISDEELEEMTDELRPFADAMTDTPTEFELITALG